MLKSSRMANFVRLLEKLIAEGVASNVNDFTVYRMADFVRPFENLIAEGVTSMVDDFTVYNQEG